MKVVYYETLKELPGVPIGSQATIVHAMGPTINVNGISFPATFGGSFPDWFRPVYEDEHQETIKRNFIEHSMKTRGYTEIEATEVWEHLCSL